MNMGCRGINKTGLPGQFSIASTQRLRVLNNRGDATGFQAPQFQKNEGPVVVCHSILDFCHSILDRRSFAGASFDRAYTPSISQSPSLTRFSRPNTRQLPKGKPYDLTHPPPTPSTLHSTSPNSVLGIILVPNISNQAIHPTAYGGAQNSQTCAAGN
jgi:hypothetical protein